MRNFTVKSTTNPYKRFRSRKARFAVHHVSKSYVIIASQKNVAKTESQQREELHFRTSQSATTCSPSALVSLEQLLNNHFFRLKRKTSANLHLTRYSFYITCVQKNSKNWLKNTLENILELNSPQERKSFNDNFCKKTNSIKIPIKD